MTARDILIVEDDDAIATGLSLNLRLAGHTATVARDGEEAINVIGERDFDLVLLDLNLPRNTGLAGRAATREADNLVPVIVLSARDGEFDKVAALLVWSIVDGVPRVGPLLAVLPLTTLAYAGLPRAAILGGSVYALFQLLDPDPRLRWPRVAALAAAVGFAAWLTPSAGASWSARLLASVPPPVNTTSGG